MEELTFRQAEQMGTVPSFEDYLQKYPSGKHVTERCTNS